MGAQLARPLLAHRSGRPLVHCGLDKQQQAGVNVQSFDAVAAVLEPVSVYNA